MTVGYILYDILYTAPCKFTKKVDREEILKNFITNMILNDETRIRKRYSFGAL